MGSTGTQMPAGDDVSATQRPREKFRRTPAWAALEEQSHGGSSSGYSTLAQVLEKCAKLGEDAQDPRKKQHARPIRVPLLNVLLTSVSQAESSGTDLGVTVVDESGEMDGTLHRGVLNDHPGKVSAGAALALSEVGVLSLSAWSHHLIIHPENVVHIVAPATERRRAAGAEAAAADELAQAQGGGDGGRPQQQYERRGDTEVVREQPTSWEDAVYGMSARDPSQESLQQQQSQGGARQLSQPRQQQQPRPDAVLSQPQPPLRPESSSAQQRPQPSWMSTTPPLSQEGTQTPQPRSTCAASGLEPRTGDGRPGSSVVVRCLNAHAPLPLPLTQATGPGAAAAVTGAAPALTTPSALARQTGRGPKQVVRSGRASNSRAKEPRPISSARA